jgi:hypothetical protein
MTISTTSGGSYIQATDLYTSKDNEWIQVPLGTQEWTRPADWLPTNVTAGEQKIQLLVSVGADLAIEANRVMSMAAIGAYTVNWGDGTAPTNHGSNTLAQHVYNPADLGPPTSEGWHQALITITAQGVGTLTTLNLSNPYYAGKTWRSPVVEAVVGSSALTAFTLASSCPLLQRVEFKQTFTPTTIASTFFNCTSLREVIGDITFTGTAASSIFNGCYMLTKFPNLTFTATSGINITSIFSSCASMIEPPLINAPAGAITNWTSAFLSCVSMVRVPAGFTVQGVTNMTSIFQSCWRLEFLPLLDTSACTNFTSAFNSCSTLREVSFTSTAAATVVSSMFNNCFVLESITNLDFSNVSSAANLTTTFTGCNRLNQVEFLSGKGPRFSWTLIGMLNAAQLNAIYTELPTVTGQTITVTGVVGGLADNPAIATAKGWTVTGS